MGDQLLSDDFSNALESHWTVADDGTIGGPGWWWSANGGLRQGSKIRGNSSDPLARPGTYLLAGELAWADYTFSVRMKTNTLDADPGPIGLVFGYRNALNYYRFSMDKKEPARRLVKVVNGLVTPLALNTTAYKIAQWYAVEAKMAQGKVEIRLDGGLLFSLKDVSHQNGKIGLYASDNSGAVFDDVLVNSIDNSGTCTYAITPSQVEVPAMATSANVGITAPGGCSWTATSKAPWITIKSGSSGTGNATLNFAVASNSATTSRQGTLIVAGLNLNVKQAASSGPGIIHVPAGGDLQAAIDQAQPGSTITLQPGAQYVGHFYLRVKPGTTFITITTSDPGKLPPAGKRISPAAAPNLPKIVTPDEYPAIIAEPGAHHYRLLGLEVRPSNTYAYELIQLGTGAMTQVSQLPHHIELDRMYLHGDAIVGTKRGVTLNSGYTLIRNSYFSDFKGDGQDTQAIAGWNGPGPYEITNNYLEAAGENILFGGSMPGIKGMVPSDITMRRNHFFKPLKWCRFSKEWDGSYWIIKNLLELKMARRVTIEGNIFENNWQQAQSGFAIVLTVRAEKKATWAVVEDVDFVRNVVRHSGGGVNILGKDGVSNNMGIARRILIRDNLFEDIDQKKWKGDGRLFQLLNGAQEVTIDHNTVVGNNINMMIMFDGAPTLKFVYRNNIALHGESGVLGSGKGIGTSSLNYYAPGAVFTNNVLVGGAAKAGAYPAGNFFPGSFGAVGFVDYLKSKYALSSTSPYLKAGTDKKDLGADINAIIASTLAAAIQ
jgi:hypothetical protein